MSPRSPESTSRSHLHRRACRRHRVRSRKMYQEREATAKTAPPAHTTRGRLRGERRVRARAIIALLRGGPLRLLIGGVRLFGARLDFSKKRFQSSLSWVEHAPLVLCRTIGLTDCRDDDRGG